MNTTTDKDIEQLRDEAGEHGDDEMVAICDLALAGDSAARIECERVIAAAAERAAEDDGDIDDGDID